MAILISKQNTDITTNQFYRVEAHQLSCRGGTLEALSTARQIAVTFANAGNCQGIVIPLQSAFIEFQTLDIRGVTVELQEFVASVWTTRATKTLTRSEIFTGTNPAGTWLIPFEFATPYAITTAASTWRFNIVSASGTTTRHFNLYKAASFHIYASWCDTLLTPVSGADFIIFKNYVDITTSFTFKAVLGAVDATYAWCGWICRNIDPTPDNVAYMRVPSTIASPVTIGIDGYISISSHGGVRAGTAAAPHAADYCKFTYTTITVGNPALAGSAFIDSSGFLGAIGTINRYSLFFYGVTPAKKLAVSTNTRTVGATTIDVDDPAAFTVGDFIMIGKRTLNAADETGQPKYTITGIAGNTLTFTPTLATANSLSGAKVVKTYNSLTNATGYGVTHRRVGGTSANSFVIAAGACSNFIMSGVFCEHVFHTGSNVSGAVEDTAYNLGYQFTNCIFLNSTVLNSYAGSYGSFLNGGQMPYTTCTFTNCIFTRQSAFTTFVYQFVTSGFPAINYFGGTLNVYNCIFMRLGANAVANGTITSPNNAGILQDYDGIYIDSLGSGRTGLWMGGLNSRWYNIEIWGHGAGVGGDTGAIRVAAFINGTANNIKINSSGIAFNFEQININSTISNVTLGNEVANTADIAFNDKSYTDITFKTVIGNPIFSDTLSGGTATAQVISRTVQGTQVKFENTNGTNIDYVRQTFGDIVRTGTGLADTIVHTAGGFALRFQPRSSAYTTYWTQNIPTGNIQNLTMTVGVWVKMNNAAYWAGSYQMPRLTVSYDNGASSNFVAAAQNTEWQFIFLAITPTTTFGQITFTVDGKTDAVGSNAYFYIDDFSAPLPQGSTLNLGKLDLFSNGLPVGPANFATTVTAADVWAADPTLFGASTVGDKVNKIKNDTALIPAIL